MTKTAPVVSVKNADAKSSVILVCEHGSRFVPDEFDSLGLSEAALKSHIAWDPGALDLALKLSKILDAKLVAGGVSRLVYDCNRPPHAPDAMPVKGENYDIDGNIGLDLQAKAARVTTYYEPFRQTLADVVTTTDDPVIVTVHSFTPVFHGQTRTVEIGILHDVDARLADQMLDVARNMHTRLRVMRNQPYGPEHGVTHTLKEHAVAHGHLNVMLEVRNDLIATQAQLKQMATQIADWLNNALAALQIKDSVKCAE